MEAKIKTDKYPTRKIIQLSVNGEMGGVDSETHITTGDAIVGAILTLSLFIFDKNNG